MMTLRGHMEKHLLHDALARALIIMSLISYKPQLVPCENVCLLLGVGPTGLLDWTTGLDWTGLLDWATGLGYWTGLLDWTTGLGWTTGLDYWTGLDWTTGYWTGPRSKLLVKTVCFSEPSLGPSLSLPEVLADSFLDALFTP